MESNKDLSVSVVVPFYNRSRFLKRLLDSVASQTLPADKIYIIDNGSSLEETLSAWSIITSHILYDKCIFTSSVGKGNANYARNLGYQLANTKYVAFLDSDDWWEKEHLEKSSRYLTESKKAAVYSGARVHRSNKIIINQSADINNFDNPFLLIISPDGYIAQTSSYIVNKEILNNKVVWSEELKRHQDFDFFAEVHYKTSGWCYCPHINVNFNRSDSGTSIKEIDHNSLITFYLKWNRLFPEKIKKDYLRSRLLLAYEADQNVTIKKFYLNELHQLGYITTLKDKLFFSDIYLSNRAKSIELLKSLKLERLAKSVVRKIKLKL